MGLFLCLALAACESAEDKAQGHYDRAIELIAQDDSKRAIVELRNALQELPTFIDARMLLANLSSADGDTAGAFRNYLRVAEQNPDNLEALIALSQIAFLEQSWDAFVQHSAAAVALAPENPQVVLIDVAGRYRTAAMDQDFTGRSAILTEAEALEADHPDDQVLRQVLIDGYLARKDYDSAIAQIEKSIADTPNDPVPYGLKLQVLGQTNDNMAIEAMLRQMVETFPDEITFHGNLVRFLIAQGKIDEAEAYLHDRVAQATDDKSSWLVTLVRFQMQQRSDEVALAELNTFIVENPDETGLRALRASLNFDSGQRDEGIAELQAILEEAGDSASKDIQEIQVTLARMLSLNGNEVGARRLVEEIITVDPNSGPALKMQAAWLIQEDDTDGAINALRTTLAESPQDIEAMSIMAAAYERAGNTDLMMNFLSLAVEASNNAPDRALAYAAALRDAGNLPQAESTLIASLRIQPNDVGILSSLGQIYLEQNDVPLARKVADTLNRLETPEARGAYAQLNLILLERESGTGDAMAYLESLAAQNDEDTNIKVALIRAKMQTGATEEALELVDELIAQYPDDPAFPYVRSVILLVTDDREGAKAVLEKITQDHPNGTRAWIQLARIATLEGDTDRIGEILDRGLAVNPQDIPLLWAKASYLQTQNDIDGAIEIYEEVYARDTQSVIIANNLASMLATFRDDEESLRRAGVIARRLKDTDVPAFQDTYGWIQHRNGNPQEALNYLEPAAEVLSGDASVQYHLGAVYEALGERDKALEQMRKAADTLDGSTEALRATIQARIEALEAEESQ